MKTSNALGVERKQVMSGCGRSLLLRGPVTFEGAGNSAKKLVSSQSSEEKFDEIIGQQKRSNATSVNVSHASAGMTEVPQSVQSSAVQLNLRPGQSQDINSRTSNVSVSVQTPNCFNTPQMLGLEGSRATNEQSDNKNKVLLQATDCCLNIATKALQKSEEIVGSSTCQLDGMIPENWDLNASDELVKIISSGNLFGDAAFGISGERADGTPFILDKKIENLPSNPKLTLTELKSEDLQELILDECTGEFVSSENKNLATDFDSKCVVQNAKTGSATENDRATPENSSTKSEAVHGKKASDEKDGNASSDKRDSRKDGVKKWPRTPSWRPWELTWRSNSSAQHLGEPKPAHTGSSVNGGKGAKNFEEDVMEPVDMTRTTLGLQVDGTDDSHDKTSEDKAIDKGNASGTTAEETSVSEEGIVSETARGNSVNSEILATDHSKEQAIEVGDQTLSQYSEDVGQFSTQQTPSEPTSPSSGMLVSSGSTGSMVDGFEDYYTDTYNEYQPEGYRNISTSIPPASSDSDVLVPLAEIHEDTTQLQKDDHQSNHRSSGVSTAAGATDDGKVSSCEQMLASFIGDEDDMSTLSVISTGSLNTTPDKTELPEGNNKEEAPKNGATSAEPLRVRTLDDLLKEKEYEDFATGINAASTPLHRSAEEQATLPYGDDDEERTEKRALETSSDDESKDRTWRPKFILKKATRKSQMKRSERLKKSSRGKKKSSDSSSDSDSGKEKPVKRKNMHTRNV